MKNPIHFLTKSLKINTRIATVYSSFDSTVQFEIYSHLKILISTSLDVIIFIFIICNLSSMEIEEVETKKNQAIRTNSETHSKTEQEDRL